MILSWHQCIIDQWQYTFVDAKWAEVTDGPGFAATIATDGIWQPLHLLSITHPVVDLMLPAAAF